jgi:hypothetical protein
VLVKAISTQVYRDPCAPHGAVTRDAGDKALVEFLDRADRARAIVSGGAGGVAAHGADADEAGVEDAGAVAVIPGTVAGICATARPRAAHTAFADRMVIGSRGTSEKPAVVPVLTPAIWSTVSKPSTTLPNTA